MRISKYIEQNKYFLKQQLVIYLLPHNNLATNKSTNKYGI